jgi:tetratricopeptide (TPR) repeat protein
MDDHLKQLLLLGREHFLKGEYNKAEYLLRQVIHETDRFADVYHMLGVIAHQDGDFLQAQRHFEQAIELNPQYTEALLNLMVTYNDLGRYEEARAIYARMRERELEGGQQLDPFARGKIANMHAEIAQAYLDVRLPMEAIAELEKAVALSGFADLRTRLGMLYRDAGDTARARQQFEAAKQSHPQYLQARVMLGVLLLSAGEHGQAMDEFRAVLEVAPDNRNAQTYLRIAQTRKDSEKPRTDSEQPPSEEPTSEKPAS